MLRVIEMKESSFLGMLPKFEFAKETRLRDV